MKVRQMFKYLLSLTMSLTLAVLANAQTEASDTTIFLNPGTWIPADTGYYLMGVDKDLVGKDGITEHYDGCYDAYGDVDHREGGVQHGWQYDQVIIFRGCSTDPATLDDAIKGTVPTENWPTVGNIIQLGKHKYALTDSASTGYLISPAFTSISELTVKVGTDLSINNNRTIWLLVEASFDDGATWEYVDNFDGTAYIYQQLTNQGGDILNYTSESGNEGFNDIISGSQNKATRLRFTPIPPPFTEGKVGERLKIWEITIKAKTVPQVAGNVLSADLSQTDWFTVQDGEFIARKGLDLTVYTLSGVKVGSGKRVPVCSKGLYIVKSNTTGESRKIYLK